MANFGHLQAHVLCKIFKTFCCNFYRFPIWDINSSGFRKICTTWNSGVRTVLKLPFDTHSYFLEPLLRQNHIRHQLQVKSIRFLYNMYYSNNTMVHSRLLLVPPKNFPLHIFQLRFFSRGSLV